MKSHRIHSWIRRNKIALVSAVYILLCGYSIDAVSQATPVVSVRFANPNYNCSDSTYCLDVEFRANTLGVQVFGMNIRFFYEDAILELDTISDFQGGYGPVDPDPPEIITGMGAFLNFSGNADWVNGAMQLMNPMAPPIFLDTMTWTKLFQVCFTFDGPVPDIHNFCPPIVWDLQVDPANGGYLGGDDGVVVTVVDPSMVMESLPSDENVVQFNWTYTTQTPYVGTPQETDCISLDCSPVITCAPDITIECDDSTFPMVTGFATATDICDGDPVITFTDTIFTGFCANYYTIERTWIAANACGLFDTCIQFIGVIDTTGPTIVCPPDLNLQCASQIPLPDPNTVTATDNCSGQVMVTFDGDFKTNITCNNRFTIVRQYLATDLCGNTNTCIQLINVFDSTVPFIQCPGNLTVQCASQVPQPNTGLVIASDNCNGLSTVAFVNDVISNQTCTNRYDVTRTYSATDDCGNSATCSQTISVFDNTVPFIQCPGDLTVQCASQVPQPNTGLVIASDNCNGLSTVTFVNDVITNQTCTNRYNVTRTYRATDDCGNSAECSQTITVFDNTVPFIQCPGNLTVQCASQVPQPNTGLVIASDNCNGLSTVTFVNDVITNQTCTNRYNVTRTYRATDDCGNSAECSQTITVFDNTVPFIQCPGNLTVQCASLVPQPNTALVISSDNCNGLSTVTFVNDVITNQTCTNRYNVTRTYRATDECGNSAECSQTITIFDNTVPFIQCPGNLTVQCASLVPLPNTGLVIASDNCNGLSSVTFIIDVITNQTCTNRYNVTRTYRATDECGNSASCSQTITVFDNTVPFIQCPGNLTVQCASLVPLPNTGLVIASDNCNGLSTVTFVNDVITNQTCTNRYNVTRTYRATDECGNSAECSQTITVFDNTAPFIQCPGDLTVQCASLVPLPNTGLVIASDNCNGLSTVTFVSDVITNQTCTNRYNVTRTYRATDECGNSASCSQTITVFDNTVPFIQCPGDLTVQCASLVPLPNTGLVIASDNCNGLSTVTFVNDVITNQTCTNRYNVTRTYRATDDCGNSATCSQTITVFDNTVPFIQCPGDLTVQCASLVPQPNTGLVIASDNCNGLSTVTFVSDVITNQTCTNRYNVTRTYRATDECGNSASCSQTITVFDNSVPFIQCPGNLTVQCASLVPLPNTGLVIASDNCNGLSTVTFLSDVISNQTCTNRYNVTRTYRATDECGNSASCSQTITVFDNTVPFIQCPGDLTVQCASLVPLPNTGLVIASDNCNGLSTVTFLSDVITNQTCTNRYNVTRTYRATDECGNSASCSQTITVFDNTVPFIQCPGDLTVQCASLVPLPNTGLVIASDNCNGLSTVTFLSDVISNQTCTNRYNVTRTYRATDECGNSASCSQTITVFDNTIPSIQCPGNLTVQCASLVPQPNTALVITSDNCNGLSTVTFVNDVITNQTCTNRYDISRTYRSTDECGNSAICTQTITVFDNTVPFIQCPGNVTVQCASQVPQPNTGLVIASDNCNGLATVTFVNDVISNQSCTNRFIVTRTYRATDECGNSATCSHTLTVYDDTVPFIQCPGNVTVQCASLVPAANTASVITSDNCGGAASVTFLGDVTSNQTCTNRFTIARTYLATDACGNSASCSQIITVFDNTIPTLTCPVNLTFQCASQVPAANPASVTTADNCGGIPTVTVVGQDVISNQTCANRFTITRTYLSTDACGNSATCAQIITVNDITAPTITCPANLTVLFGASTLPVTTGNPTGSDNCTGAPVFTFVDVITPGNCPEDFIINRTWTATDACAMTSTCLQTIRVDGNCSIDLSLIKVLNPIQGNVVGGDIISFTITVSNDGQGDIGSITITDYIPIGFTLNDPDWTPGNAGNTGQSASITLSVANGGLDPNGLNPGESVSVQITLQADLNIQPGQYFNSAEISQVLNIQGVDVSDDDVDSDADADNTNDPPGEDDISLAAICILPQPVILGDPFVCPGENVTYTVQNYNPSFTYNWSLNGGGTITANTGQTITIHWLNIPGNFQIQLDVIIAPGCQATTFLNVVVEAFEVLACDDHIQISLDGDCQVVIVPSMILEGQLYGENYIVILLDENGDTIPDATLTYEHIGQIITVKIISECFVNSCWGTITVEDKIAPEITCACPLEGSKGQSCEITCLEVDQLVNGIIPGDLQPDVSDNCGQVTVEIIDIDVNYDNCVGGFVHVTWLATDLSGNTATCVEAFTVIPLTLESLTFPINYIGSCGTSVNPIVTGWPQVNGVNITDAGGVCNIFAGYWDEELNECGGGRKIFRTWTVLDWCTVELVEYTQIIKLIDNEGPVLTCPPNITVGTEFWYCYANVSVPKPQAYDVCSDVVSFELSSNAGSIVHFGNNNYVINGLILGTYPVIWTVSDECGNSSTCSFLITVKDDVVPVANCDQHTIVALTNDGPGGVTLVPAEVFNDGSYDNCGPVTFRVRRMDSCIDVDWTTSGACVDDHPNGYVDGNDQGTVRRPCVPFSCCDVGAGPIMVELEVTDVAGNVNYCMVEAEVQDKISPFVECPPDITVSCDFWFNVQEGTFTDQEGNNNGNLDEDPLTPVFGNMWDAFRYPESVREDIIINDPGNNDYHQPHFWGIDGWADDNCEVNLQVRVRVYNDCTGDDLPSGAPANAVKLVERRFSASDGNQGIAPGVCSQRIWVVDFDPFFITDQACNLYNNDDVVWPCDVLLTECPENPGDTGEPIVYDDACSLIGVAYEDQRFNFVDGACYKILRTWSVIDWCQYNSLTGEGLWHYTQVIKVHDNEGPEFLNCPTGPVTLCVADEGVSLPNNNQAFLGHDNPLSSSCSVHLNLCQEVHETCSDVVNYDVKFYLDNGDEFFYVKTLSSVEVDSNHNARLCFDTRENSIKAIRDNGIPYNSPFCGYYHKILWSAEDGCGNWSHCEYLIRLEDCKQPSPVCINGLSTVVMPFGGQVTIWAKDFNASSFDDCTAEEDLLYSFSGTSYTPSFTYNCDNVPAFGVELSVNIWVADGGTDDNCNNQISWNERNKDFCTTTIVITDNANVCDTTGSVLSGQILTDLGLPVSQVKVTLTSPGQVFPDYITTADGTYRFDHLLPGTNYTITPVRNDNHKNGVSTLDLVRIQKHLLGLQDFTSPYQYIAADANNSSSVSAIDLVELRKLILGIYSALPNNKSWSFVDKKYSMPNPAHPWPYDGAIHIEALQGRIYDNDFIGVKVGDVNNTALANALQVLPRDARRVMNVKASAPEWVESGDEVEMKMSLPYNVSGFQWTLETDGMEYLGVHSEDIQIGDENIGLLENGIVTMSWNGIHSGQYGVSNGPTIILKWKVTTPGKVSKMIRMSSLVTPAESYSEADEVMDVKLSYLSDQGQTEFGLYQNKPNPWNGQTLIGFDLPKDDHARLMIFDAAGKTLKTIEGQFKAGYNSIELTEKDIPSSGVLYYRLESGENSASKKMIILR